MLLVSGLASRVGHKAGQSVEVDWSGKTMTLCRPARGHTDESLLSLRRLPAVLALRVC